MSINNLQIPILQAPVESTASLASAVSNAGGMGSVQGTWSSPEEAAALVEEILSETANPFFVNFVLSFTPVSLDAVIEAGAPAVTFSWGMDPDLVNRAHKKNVAVGIQIGSPEGARMATSNGADFIICQGIEAGGHVQSTTELEILLPRVLDSSGEIPVFAAGGLADADDIAWALQQGARGAMLETRFLATKESNAHDLYKQAILSSDSSDTVYTVCFDGGWSLAPHRVIRNKTLNDWEAAGCPPVGRRPREGDIVARDSAGYEVERYSSDYPKVFYKESQMDDMCLYAGTGCTKINDIPSVSELVRRLSEDS